jgi:hypothetical protein
MTRALISAMAFAAFVGVTAVAAQTPTPTPAPTPGTNVGGPNFVDANGDGICDQCGTGGGAQRTGKGARRGPGDGTGNRGIGPKDGTGRGPGPSACGGTCNGTGPKGAARRGRR